MYDVKAEFGENRVFGNLKDYAVLVELATTSDDSENSILVGFPTTNDEIAKALKKLNNPHFITPVWHSDYKDYDTDIFYIYRDETITDMYKYNESIKELIHIHETDTVKADMIQRIMETDELTIAEAIDKVDEVEKFYPNWDMYYLAHEFLETHFPGHDSGIDIEKFVDMETLMDTLIEKMGYREAPDGVIKWKNEYKAIPEKHEYIF